jgi:hypothetical protein
MNTADCRFFGAHHQEIRYIEYKQGQEIKNDVGVAFVVANGIKYH